MRPPVAAWLVAAPITICFYLAALKAVGDPKPVVTMLCNAFPLLVLAPLTSLVIQRTVLHRRILRQSVMHVALAIAFFVIWYAAVITLLGLSSGSFNTFRVRQWWGPVVVWQLFQSSAFYVAVAACTHMFDALARLRAVEEAAGAPAGRVTPGRLLLRRGDEIHNVDVSDIVRIQGNDDYSDVVTDTARLLARRTLGEFEQELDPQRFLRVHRSHIINLAGLVRAEPAGNGRITLHLRNGDAVVASRAGSRLLRERSR